MDRLRCVVERITYLERHFGFNINNYTRSHGGDCVFVDENRDFSNLGVDILVVLGAMPTEENYYSVYDSGIPISRVNSGDSDSIYNFVTACISPHLYTVHDTMGGVLFNNSGSESP